MSATLVLRSTLEIARRLARRRLGTYEGYWPADEVLDVTIKLAQGESFVVPTNVVWTKVIVECAKDAPLKARWTFNANQVEMNVEQLLALTGPLASLTIIHSGAVGSDAFTFHLTAA